jgi:hypothetical protein
LYALELKYQIAHGDLESVPAHLNKVKVTNYNRCNMQGYTRKQDALNAVHVVLDVQNKLLEDRLKHDKTKINFMKAKFCVEINCN